MKLVIILASLFAIFWQGPIIVARICYRISVKSTSFLIFALGCVGVTAYLMGLY